MAKTLFLYVEFERICPRCSNCELYALQLSVSRSPTVGSRAKTVSWKCAAEEQELPYHVRVIADLFKQGMQTDSEEITCQRKDRLQVEPYDAQVF